MNSIVQSLLEDRREASSTMRITGFGEGMFLIAKKPWKVLGVHFSAVLKLNSSWSVVRNFLHKLSQNTEGPSVLTVASKVTIRISNSCGSNPAFLISSG
jgi:hypothetical protein